MPERIFNKETMLELLYCRPNEGFTENGIEYMVIQKEQIDTRRWVSSHELTFQIIENEKISYWLTTYERGLTEQQDTQPWDDDEVSAFEAEKVTRSITVTEYNQILD
jgi:hypothetical protein